jgi:phage repressor protein C with HTH and peptisase S24 domain
MSELASRLKQARAESKLSQAGLAKRIGAGQSTIASIENGRNNGSGRLVDIAKVLGVRPEWLSNGDGPMRSMERDGGLTPSSDHSKSSVTIGRYDTGGRMGMAGVELRDQPGVIESWQVSREWLEKNVRGFATTNSLCIVTGFGDSMRPLFNPGDPLIIDGSVKSVEFDAVYFFRVGNEGFIKRLQRVPGKGLLAISENSAYRDWVIDESMDFEVFGRVLKVWRSEDF